MQQANHVTEAPVDDKNLDPYNALEKVIRLDKKHTNFEYYDPERNFCFRVTYPIPQFQAPSNEHLLKGFWRHVNNYYFKKIQQSELQRLEYIETIMKPLNQCDVRFSGSMEFWYTVERIFSEGYLNRFKKGELDSIDCRNWLEEMFLVWERTDAKDKNRKKVEGEINAVVECFAQLKNLDKLQDDKKKMDRFRAEEKMIQKLLPPQDDDDYWSLEIRELQAELNHECSRNRELLQTLKARVRKELDQEDVSIIRCCEEQALESEDVDTGREDGGRLSKSRRNIQKIQTVTTIKNYLQYCIKNLQKRQVAQSISKISNLSKAKSQPLYQLQFQTGMNIRKVLVPQSKLLELNKLRQYNLFKFYNTSLKTPYSFICQNFYGFRWIFQNRNQPCALKDKNIMEEMKKGKGDFDKNSFDICHHCKLMYPQTYLTKCQYNSSKNGAPITPSSYYDPYISQIIKLQQPKLSNRFMGRKRTPYLGYTKINDEYTCQRKFCQYCMRQNYSEGLDKNGLCPFCQGICFCTRCARNDMIVRLKSMFLLLGGDVEQLEDGGYFESIISGDGEMLNGIEPNQRQVSRSKIKPVKKVASSTPARLNEKMRNIRYQLQDLRILCDLVKRRQKQKQKLVQIRCQLFNKKVSMLSKGLDIKALNDSSINTLIQEQDQQQQKKLKLQKKLGRMI